MVKSKVGKKVATKDDLSVASKDALMAYRMVGTMVLEWAVLKDTMMVAQMVD